MSIHCCGSSWDARNKKSLSGKEGKELYFLVQTPLWFLLEFQLNAISIFFLMLQNYLELYLSVYFSFEFE